MVSESLSVRCFITPSDVWIYYATLLIQALAFYPWFECNLQRKVRLLGALSVTYKALPNNSLEVEVPESQAKKHRDTYRLKEKLHFGGRERTVELDRTGVTGVIPINADLVASRQAVHLHQLTLSVQDQLCEGEQLGGQRALR